MKWNALDFKYSWAQLLCLIFTGMAVIFWPVYAPAYADEEPVHKVLKDVVSSFEQTVPDYDFIWDGEPLIEDAGSFHAITLPYLRVERGTESGIESVDIGLIALNAKPVQDTAEHAGMEKWLVTAAMPVPIRWFSQDADGPKERLRLGVGDQDISFNVVQGQIGKARIKLTDISLLYAGEQLVAPEVLLRIDRENNGQRFDIFIKDFRAVISQLSEGQNKALLNIVYALGQKYEDEDGVYRFYRVETRQDSTSINGNAIDDILVLMGGSKNDTSKE